MAKLETVLKSQEQPDMVCIPRKEYDELLDDSMKLHCLEAGGVDNWEWYGESLGEYRKYKGEIDEDDEDDEE